jgi:hypothetical protein
MKAKPFDFQETIDLLNDSRNISIDSTPPVQRQGRRALHCERYKVHTPTIDFEVIYLGSGVTNDAIDEAFNKHFHPGKTHVERRLLIEPSPAPESTYS